MFCKLGPWTRSDTRSQWRQTSVSVIWSDRRIWYLSHFIWTAVATIGSLNLVNIQRIPAQVVLEGNTKADLEAKQWTVLQQSSAPMDLTSTCAVVKRHQQSVADDRHLSNPHAGVHRVFTASVPKFQHWQRDWTSVLQCPRYTLLLAGYLYRIGRRDSATCPHCNDAEDNGRAPGASLPSSSPGQKRHLAGREVNSTRTRDVFGLGEDWGCSLLPTGNEREREIENCLQRQQNK